LPVSRETFRRISGIQEKGGFLCAQGVSSKPFFYPTLKPR
jgi:hypothetical protein